MATFTSILVPTDFSSAAEPALELGIRLARENRATLTLLHTWEVPMYAYSTVPFTPVDLLAPIEDAAKKQLDDKLAEVRKQIPDAKAILMRGFPPEQILAAAAEVKADLVVMGTHGRRGISHALLGSVAERVVRTSTVPVLTVRDRAR